MESGRTNQSSRKITRARVIVACVLLAGVLTGVLVAQVAQAGAGALDVTSFGARGDGVTDNTAIIQSVIDKAGSTPVYIPAGTYVITGSLNLRTDLTLYGAGSSTVIKLVGGDDWTRAIVGTTVGSVTLRDLTVDGDAASATVTGTGEQRHCVFLNACSNCLIQNVTVTQPMGDGIFLYGGSSGIIVKNCTCVGGNSKNPRVGINVQGANNSVVTGCSVQNFAVGYKSEIDAGEGDSTGVQILNNSTSGTSNPLALNGKPDGRCRNYLVQGNTFVATGTSNIWVSGTVGCIIKGNTLTGGTGVYACFDNHSLTVQGNVVNGNCDCDVYLGEIYNLGASDGIHVTGNTFQSIAHNQGDIFHVGTTVTNVEIDSNHYTGTVTFYNPVLGASANVHDNTADAGSATTNTTAATTVTTAAATVTTAAPTTTTTIAAVTPTTTQATTTTTTAATTTTTTQATTTTTVAPTTTTTAAPVSSAGSATTVVIASPANGTVISGRVSVAVSVISYKQIGQVLLFVDGQQRGQASRAPYSFTLVTSTMTTGAHSLVAVAYDRQGAELGRASCTVTVAAAASSGSSSGSTTSTTSSRRWFFF